MFTESAKSLSFEFLQSGIFNSNKYYDIQSKGQKQRYQVVKINSFTKFRSRFSLILQEVHINSMNKVAGCRPFMLVKGNERSVLQKCNLEQHQREAIQRLMSYFRLYGRQFVVFAKKSLTQQQITDLEKNLQQIKTERTNESEMIDRAIDQFESNLTLLGIAVVKDKLRPGIKYVLEILNHTQIQRYMLSGDTKSQCVSTAYQSRFISKNSKFLNIDNVEVGELCYQIKSHIQFLSTLMQTKNQEGTNNPDAAKAPDQTSFPPDAGRKADSAAAHRLRQDKHRLGYSNMKMNASIDVNLKNLVLVVDGLSLDKIMYDNYLKQHFLFICQAVHSVIGYNFSSMAKAKFIHLLKKGSINSAPTILTIGSSFQDRLMMQMSDVSINLESLKQRYKLKIGDICLQDVRHLRTLLFRDSINQTNQMKDLVLRTFKLGVYYTLFKVIYSLQNHQVTSALFTTFYDILYYAYLLLLFLFTILADQSYSFTLMVLQVYPVFYRFSNMKLFL